MSLARLLLVDDSEAILAFEKAALGAYYAIWTANNGRAALSVLVELRPDAVLLDLSMPEMDGEQVFDRMRGDPSLAKIPVVVVSTEFERGEALVARGAAAFLPKPIRADELLAVIARVLDQAREQLRRESLAFLVVQVGPLEFALPLAAVRLVLQELAGYPVPGGPLAVRRAFELDGRPILVADAAKLLAVDNLLPFQDRVLVVVEHEGLELALSVDRVRDPEEVGEADITPGASLAGSEHGRLRDVLVAVARTERGQLPVVTPGALVSPELVSELAALLKGAAGWFGASAPSS
ncbi:MAG TPA: response regulator [Polyangiaceae bacterium]|nr:response regulator [Polyangiaceae bacterium]